MSDQVEDTNYINSSKWLSVGDGDILHNYKWGIHSSTQLHLNEIPAMILREFQTKNGPMQDDLIYLGSQIVAGAKVIGNVITGAVQATANTAAQGIATIFGESGISKELYEMRTDISDSVASKNADTAYSNKIYSSDFTNNVYILPYFSQVN